MGPRTSARAAQLDASTCVELAGRLAGNVRRLRAAQGWTQAVCAERCRDLDITLLRAIEAGRANATLATLARLCDGFGVEASELLAPTAPLAKRGRGRPAKSRAAVDDVVAPSEPQGAGSRDLKA
jgi:transcriptional regulator with XRE-family HTH domain